MEIRINEALKEAMKENNTLRKEVLRDIKSAFATAKTEKNAKEFDDSRAIQIMQRLVKQREDSMSDFERGNRPDLVKQMEDEAMVIREFLPRTIPGETLDQIIQDIIRINPTAKMGDVIKLVTAEVVALGFVTSGSYTAQQVKFALHAKV